MNKPNLLNRILYPKTTVGILSRNIVEVKMTVRYVREGIINQQNQKVTAICEWMCLDHKLHSHEFAITSLEKA